jgi:nucleoside-diphosphate-sugar epimerase
MAIYRLYRGVDIRDAANAHILAMEKEMNGHGVINISAESPFTEDESVDLLHKAGEVLLRHFPIIEEEFAKKGWKLPRSIDRVYSIEKAKRYLDYRPQYNFDTLMDIK